MLEARRRHALSRKRKQVMPLTPHEAHLRKILCKFEQVYRATRSEHQKVYMELINLCYENRRKAPGPDEAVRIHFLFYSPAHWPSWRSVYYACMEDVRADVKIVLLDTENTPEETSVTKGGRDFLVREGVDFIEYAQYDIVEQKPHVIVYNYPYNHVYHYFAQFNAPVVKKLGIRPAYIHYGIEFDQPRGTDGILNHYHYLNACQCLAWKRFAIHDDIRKGAFKHGYLGGSNVVVGEVPKFDTYLETQARVMPEDLAARADGRTILAFQLHYPPHDREYTYKYRTHSLPCREIIAVLRYLAGQTSFLTAVMVHPLFETRVLRERVVTKEQWRELLQSVQESPNLFLYKGDYQSLLFHADYFITELSSLMIEMAFLNKPTLYLYDEPSCFKPFAEHMIASFYHGSGLEDVKKFIRDVVKNHDGAEKCTPVLDMRQGDSPETAGKRIARAIIEGVLAESECSAT
jgi:Putative glycosyl/glycerophosphate transferases involved in teichoic acid biosynthesis TagF/TagB/EpsJ/RodC